MPLRREGSRRTTLLLAPSRPLRANGKAYKVINIVMLWASAVEQGFAAPIWTTYKQAQELGAVDLMCCLCRKLSGALAFGAVRIACVGQLFPADPDR